MESAIAGRNIIAEKTGIAWVSSVFSPSSLVSAYDVAAAASSYEQAIAVVERDTALRRYRWHARLWSAPVRQLAMRFSEWRNNHSGMTAK